MHYQHEDGSFSKSDEFQKKTNDEEQYLSFMSPTEKCLIENTKKNNLTLVDLIEDL